MAAPPDPLISIVSPLFNERDNVAELVRRVREALQGHRFEMVLVDDGSTDGTLDVATGLATDHPEVKLLLLSRNFGHQAAITAGIEHAKGDAVVVMDADLQDPPEVIPDFIQRWKEGFDVIYAVRRDRKESAVKKAAYSAFYRIWKKVSYLDIPLDSGDFSLMDRRVVDVLNHLPERNRFVRGIRTWVGFRQAGIEYERHERAAGKSKYTYRKLLKLAYDGLISFSHAPLRAISALGMLCALVSFLVILVVLYIRLFTELSVPGFATTAIIILFLGGVQLLAIGILGEYVSRIFDEVKKRPNYVVAERINLEADNTEAKRDSEQHVDTAP